MSDPDRLGSVAAITGDIASYIEGRGYDPYGKPREDGKRFAYLHYIGKHSEYGDAVLVNPRFQERQTSVAADIFSGAYVAFYPVTAAVSQGLVDVVANMSPPSHPSRLRRAGARSGHRVDT